MKKIILSIAITFSILILIWQMFLRDIELAGKATLSWNASTEADIAGYKIYYGNSKRTGDCPQGGYAKKIDAGNKTSYQLENLEEGKVYYFSVTSVNAAGKESCFSEEMSKEIKISFLDKVRSLFN